MKGVIVAVLRIAAAIWANGGRQFISDAWKELRNETKEL